jgi:hypothetical protein
MKKNNWLQETFLTVRGRTAHAWRTRRDWGREWVKGFATIAAAVVAAFFLWFVLEHFARLAQTGLYPLRTTRVVQTGSVS